MQITQRNQAHRQRIIALRTKQKSRFGLRTIKDLFCLFTCLPKSMTWNFVKRLPMHWKAIPDPESARSEAFMHVIYRWGYFIAGCFAHICYIKWLGFLTTCQCQITLFFKLTTSRCFFKIVYCSSHQNEPLVFCRKLYSDASSSEPGWCAVDRSSHWKDGVTHRQWNSRIMNIYVITLIYLFRVFYIALLPCMMLTK